MNFKVGNNMIPSYLESIILQCLLRINGERTVYSVYHLISGKKSSQTIQDGHLFGISKYYRTYTVISREEYDRIMLTFEEIGFIEIKQSNGEYELRERAGEMLERYRKQFPAVQHVNGFQFHGVEKDFWKKFSLIFQVLSNNVHGNNKYFSVQRDRAVQQWVKSFLFQHKDWKSLSLLLYAEMNKLLSQLLDEHGKVFLLKLSGYHRVGYSNSQIASLLDLEETYVHYLFVDVLHFLLAHTAARPESFPILNAICNRMEERHQLPLTRSSLTTLSYLKRGYTIEEIAQARELKRNTIEDHLVELVFHGEDIDLSPIISNNQIEYILRIATNMQTRQLKVIKQALPDTVSYFLIRLALAKGGTLE